MPSKLSSGLLDLVSMKSGLEGRNNFQHAYIPFLVRLVSMKSGLEGRNNFPKNLSHSKIAALSQ